MKRHAKVNLLVFLFLTTIVSIGSNFNTKDSYLKSFTKFIENMEKNYQTYTKKDWYAKKIEYEKFVGEKYDQFQKQFTDEDLQTIGKLKARYYKIILKSGIDELENDIKKGAKQLKGFIEEICSDTNSKN